jgi:hypothetical protein
MLRAGRAGVKKGKTMSGFNDYKALESAVQIVTAAAQANALKLNGMPSIYENAATSGKADGEYVAALLNAIAAGIKTKPE